MKKADIKIGGKYTARISGKLTTVQIVSESPCGGWTGQNVATGREVRIRTAAKFRNPIGISATTSRADFWAQWHALKDRNPETILLFRMDEYFEAYGVDAVKVAGGLCVKLAVMVDGYAEIDVVSIPHERLGDSLVTLASIGYKVAVCERVDGPTPSGQSVDRIVTPGSLVG